MRSNERASKEPMGDNSIADNAIGNFDNPSMAIFHSVLDEAPSVGTPACDVIEVD